MNLWTFLYLWRCNTKPEAVRRQTSIWASFSYKWYSATHSSPKLLTPVPLDRVMKHQSLELKRTIQSNKGLGKRLCEEFLQPEEGRSAESLERNSSPVSSKWKVNRKPCSKAKIMGISLFKGGKRAKSSEDLWHPAEISAVFVSQCSWFIFSSRVAGEQHVRLELCRAALSVRDLSLNREKWADDLLTAQIDSFCYPGPGNSAKFQRQQNHLKFPFNLRMRFPAL